MTNSMIPYSFTPGTKAKAQEVNANFIALADKIDENNATAMHYNSSATVSGNMTFTKPLVSTGTFGVSQGNLTVKNLANTGVTDAVLVINSDTNQRCGSLRFTNGDGYNEIALCAATEDGATISMMGMCNTNGTPYAYGPTWTNYADSSTKIVTTAYLANRWTTTKATTTSTASKARPAVVIQNYISGTNWYRVWSDGWIEQGGRVYIEKDSTVTVSLPKAFTTTNYIVFTQSGQTETNDEWNNGAKVISKAVSSIQIQIRGRAGNRDWFACGY